MSLVTFHGGPSPTLGVELELQLVDASSMALSGVIGEVLADVPKPLQDAIKPEFYDSCVEINTRVCSDITEVRQDLGAKLKLTERIAGAHGVLLGWGGTHPFSNWRDQPIFPSPRYRELAERYGETLCRQLTFGLHVHVGVEDGTTAVKVCNRIAKYLPILLALSANSPFWCGRVTGQQAYRVEVMGASPTGGLPPRFEGWESYARIVHNLTAAGVIQTPKELWWDVRPNPEFGTVEIRMCDMPLDLDAALEIAALTQCLVVDLAQQPAEEPIDDCGVIIVHQNRWLAARYGLDAILVDPKTGRSSSARELVRGLIIKLSGIAETLGCTHTLAQLLTALDHPMGAEQQLAAFEHSGDLAAVVRLQTHQPNRQPVPPFENRDCVKSPTETPIARTYSLWQTSTNPKVTSV